MNWFTSLFRRKDVTRQLAAVHFLGRPVATPRNYEQFAQEGYRKNVIAYRCIQLIATSCSAIPWLMYRGEGKSRKEVLTHPLLDLLGKPNPMQSAAEFKEAVIAYKLISGNSYIHAVSSGSRIQELFPVRPDRMRVVPGESGYPVGYEYTAGGGKVTIQVDPVSLQSPILHLRMFNPIDDWYGMSPVEAACYGIDQHNQSSKWNLALLMNSAMPSGALVAAVSDSNPSGTLGEDQFERLKNQIEENYSGAKNAGRPLLLEGGLDWKQMSLSPKDMDWVQSRHTSARDIAQAFGVPPMLLGIPGDNTYSNYKEANLSFYKQTVIPHTIHLRDWLNRWLVQPAEPGLVLDFDRDQIDALSADRAEVWAQTQTCDFLTINEKRERLGYGAVNGGDVVLVSAVLLPLDSASEPREEDDPSEFEDDEDEDEGKSLDLKSDRGRLRVWQEKNRLRVGFERGFQRRASAVFKSEGDRVLKALEGIDAAGIEAAVEREIEASREAWGSILRSGLHSSGKRFGERVLHALKSLPSDIERKDAASKFQQGLLTWIENYAGLEITRISKVSKKRVLNAIREALAESQTGEESVGSEEAARMVRDAVKSEYLSMSQSRAATIARTEIGSAMHAAELEAVRSSGVPSPRKEWIAGPADGRERIEHQAMDGVEVGVDEKFSVDGEEMDGPGDPHASAENRINCRCTLGYTSGE